MAAIHRPSGLNADLVACVLEWAARNTPGHTPDYLTIHFPTLPVPVTLPVVALRCAASPPCDEPEEEPPFVPTPFQKGILEALDGKALRTDALGAAVGDRRRLFKDGGLKELRDRGLVLRHARLGFYRPDAPPPQLTDGANS